MGPAGRIMKCSAKLKPGGNLLQTRFVAAITSGAQGLRSRRSTIKVAQHVLGNTSSTRGARSNSQVSWMLKRCITRSLNKPAAGRAAATAPPRRADTCQLSVPCLPPRANLPDTYDRSQSLWKTTHSVKNTSFYILNLTIYKCLLLFNCNYRISDVWCNDLKC